MGLAWIRLECEASVKKRAGGSTGSSSLSYSQAIEVARLKEREPSQARMPLLANLLLDGKSGCRDGGMGGALFIRFRIYGANQMIDGRLFSHVPSPCATSRQGGFGHR
jgi:hypothetical protein